MAYEVSSYFLEQVAKRGQSPVRKFYIGTSDYSERVTKWPTFKRTANNIKSINIDIPLANADGHFNTFYHDTYLMPNTVTLEMGGPFVFKTDPVVIETANDTETEVNQ